MLFKHGKSAAVDKSAEKEEKAEKKEIKPVVTEEKPKSAAPAVPPLQSATPPKDVSPEALRELLEKNLKWSQIIYEQNRKINSKLFWTAFASWVRLTILVGAFAVAAWYLPPLVGSMIQRYNELLSDPTALLKGSVGGSDGDVSADLCNFLPPNLQESCKAITSKK